MTQERGITEHSNAACGCDECTDMRARHGGGRAFNLATGEYEWLTVESDPSTGR